MIPPEWFAAASARIAPFIIRTPLTHDPVRQFFFKWENQQVTGSFKVRGALNKVLSLQPWELAAGLTTASAGNHGQGVAFAARQAGARVIVFASDHAVESKVAAMRVLGAEVRLVAGGYAEAEAAGIRHARETGSMWISPYNDGEVIAGQGTLGLEIAGQAVGQGVKSIVIPAGGGGLASGVGLALRQLPGPPEIIAAQSESSSFLYALYTHGSQAGVIELPSLADGLAGPVEEGSVTAPIIRQVASQFLLVSEEEIAAALVFAWQEYRQVIEGSAAAALAAALFRKSIQLPAVILISGGNIEPAVHSRLVSGASAGL